MKPRINIVHAQQTEVGRRSANDDYIYVDEEIGVYLVCDGAGGQMGGRVAAETVCNTFREGRRELADQIGEVITPQTEQVVDAFLMAAHKRILEHQAADARLSNMTTTAVLVVRRGDEVLASHVGDSRIYLYREFELRQLTKDHSLENYLKDNPQLRPKVKRPGKTLVRALGLKTKHLGATHRRLTLQREDLLLLCSDGLTDSIPGWTLREILAGAEYSPLDEISRSLVRAALSHGSMDNISLVLVQATARNTVFERQSGATDRSILGWVAFIEGPKRGDVLQLGGSTIFGADPGCHVAISDGYVSSHHLEIIRDEHGFALRDLGSTNGTHINNVKATEAFLIDGDLVKIGTTEMMFKCYELPH